MIWVSAFCLSKLLRDALRCWCSGRVLAALNVGVIIQIQVQRLLLRIAVGAGGACLLLVGLFKIGGLAFDITSLLLVFIFWGCRSGNLKLVALWRVNFRFTLLEFSFCNNLFLDYIVVSEGLLHCNVMRVGWVNWCWIWNREDCPVSVLLDDLLRPAISNMLHQNHSNDVQFLL